MTARIDDDRIQAVRNRAYDKWPNVLQSLGGLTECQVTKRHQPCPACGGTDRYRMDDKHGDGGYYCNGCGAGDGISLLMKVNGWRFNEAITALEAHFGLSTETLPETPPRTPQKQPQRVQEPSPTLPYARAIWQRVDQSDYAIAGHPYAVRKRIRHAAGAGRATVTGSLVGERADCIIVPMRTLAGELVGVECINPEGKKQTFGNKGILILGNDLDPKLPQLVVEGWACAVGWFLIHKGNIAVYAAFSKSRLRPVAEEVEAKHPRRTIVICREADK